MPVAGMITEYNPLHYGHVHLLEETRRRLGPETGILCVMSGNFVQRGDFALTDKWSRAAAAVRSGADLVLELPLPWATASAGGFATGAVKTLRATGLVTHLVFGSEGGDAAPLVRLAEALGSAEFGQALRRELTRGDSFAAARQRAAASLLSPEDAAPLARPNDLLAVEYCGALRDSGIQALAIARRGSGHDGGQADGFSASAIRARLLAGGDGWREHVPEAAAAIVDRELAAGRAPVSIANCERAALARLRSMPEASFAVYDGGGEGLYHRFYQAVHSAASLEGILLAAKTKRYPLARLRRMLLHSYLDIRTPGRDELPPYLRVLGANGRGRALLKEMRKRASVPVLTKPGHAGRLGRAAQSLMALESRYTDLYVLAYPDLSQAMPGGEYTANPAML